MALVIRTTTPADEAAIHRLHEAAFGPREGRVVADLAVALLHDPTAEPVLSLMADADATAAGHVLFSGVRLIDPSSPVSARILAPLAVRPEHRGRGLGARLVNDGLARLTDAGCGIVFVLGDPAYYRRLGFRPATPRGLRAPYPIPDPHADAWMAMDLDPGAARDLHGTVRCARSLHRPEHWIE